MEKKFKIAIVNYEVGNTCSVKNAFERFEDCEILLTDDLNKILTADAIILPGVGAFRDATKALINKNLSTTLESVAFSKKKPFLAICLGMQLLFESSEEGGDYKGLGWIPGKVVKFDVPGLHVPHFGWNDLKINISSPLFNSLNDSPNFYFAHSYHASCDKKYILGSCDYGIDVPAIVQNENIIGMQFHPEKSHNNGLTVLKNFVNYAKGDYA